MTRSSMSPRHQQRIVSFIQHSPILRPVAWSQAIPPTHRSPYPTAAQMADELLTDPEFQALRLASWLRSPDGALIAEAVGLVIPPVYRLEYELGVEALQLAAEMQHARGRRQRLAGILALTGISILGVGVLAPAVRRAA